MSTTSTSAQVPKLRFPGFEGEWDQAELGTLAEIKLGKMLDKAKHTSGRLLPYLNNISLRWNEVDTSNLPQMYFDDDELERFGLKAGDVVVCEGGEPGRAAVWDGRLPDLKFQKAIHRVRFKVPFEQRLLVLYLEHISGTTQFEMLFTGGGIKHLTRETFAALKVPLIAYPEQQKIAAFLTAVDGRIEQLSRKKALLEEYKKGVMQQLFTQTLRFQDDHGHDFPDWEEKTLGELTTWTSGGTPSKDEPSYWDGDIPWLSAASMHERYYDDSPLKISEEGLRNGSRIAKRGSLLLLVRGSMLWNRIPVGIAKRDLAFNQDVKALVPTKAVQVEFLLQWFIASENLLLHAVVGTGIGAGKLDTEEMKRLQVQLPSLPEQTKIASFLSALDGKIAAVGEQMRQTQAWKKGLLQQLFV